ncbi:CAP domain-containing protein [Bacillus paralicheniformis]|uniref:CAP domain-containing protein n=1 Tax=Bacillus paralicheniformis TaxID=1648923 RepID=UPI00227F8BEB|nr:CAP domain-containing protein [Bacillus paralicheniformis]MCY8181990.1 CAP domain-containing protein [Bacillus paralicheniformis]WMW49112.1 CAP domain-containing protein [Bacillus paralicheniformis]
MKNILRAVVILLIVAASYTLFIQYGSTPEEIVKEDKPQVSNEDAKKEKSLNIPDSGLLSFIGESAETIEKKLGKPDRVDPSAYDYEWWVYSQGAKQYVQIGLLGGKAVTLFATGDGLNTAPFKIGRPSREVFKTAQIAPYVNVQYKGSSYRFEFSEEDMNTRPTVKVGDIYVQLYMDKFEGTLSSIRAFDAPTFIKQRPYEVVYRGTLIEPQALTESDWKKIEKANEKQIFDLTNVIRARHGLSQLSWDEGVSKVAYGHSSDMKEHHYFSHVSETEGTLKDRLEKGKVNFEQAGENIALNYVDGPAAVEGWLNSEGHRKALLNADYTHLGVGVDEKYYTQNFIKEWH